MRTSLTTPAIGTQAPPARPVRIAPVDRRRGAAEVRLGERLVDDERAGRGRPIGGGERPAGEQALADGGK